MLRRQVLKSKDVEYDYEIVKDGRHAFTVYPDGVNGMKDLRPGMIRFLDKYSGIGKYRK